MRVLYPGWIGFCRCWFSWREENRRTQRKTLRARQEPTNSTHIWHRGGVEPGSQETGMWQTLTPPHLPWTPKLFKIHQRWRSPFNNSDYLAIVLHGQLIFWKFHSAQIWAKSHRSHLTSCKFMDIQQAYHSMCSCLRIESMRVMKKALKIGIFRPRCDLDVQFSELYS